MGTSVLTGKDSGCSCSLKHQISHTSTSKKRQLPRDLVYQPYTIFVCLSQAKDAS